MKIASFNVQRFGRRKIKNQQVFIALLKIIKRYDIIVVLEVVDRSGVSVETLLDALGRDEYGCETSQRLGRGRYKEQYMYLYKKSSVAVKSVYQYDDVVVQDCDVFARDPFIVRFKLLKSKTSIKDLTVVPIHTKPVESKTEIDGLQCVVEHVRRMWRTNNVMIVGDFNADGTYVSCSSMKCISIRADKNYHWLIRDDEDTTTRTSNDHTYDRIVVYGKQLHKACRLARPFNYQEEYGMTEEQALAVSDHYPVEVDIKID